MLYLHVLDTHDDDFPIKSMFVENEDSCRLAQMISLAELDNIVIVNSIEIDRDTLNKRIVKIQHIFLNGNEDVIYPETLKVDKKN
jgi:hypothetical protein